MLEIGIISGFLNLGGTLLYVDEVLRRKSVPERATWFIWSLLGLIALFSQKSLGATDSLWFVGLQTVGVTLVFLLSIRLGTGGLSKFDYSLIALAAAGIGLWVVTSDPLLSLIMVVLIRSVGITATIRKTERSPGSEAVAPWLLYAVSATLALLSVGRLDFALLLYPAYVLTADTSVVIAKMVGQRRQAA